MNKMSNVNDVLLLLFEVRLLKRRQTHRENRLNDSGLPSKLDLNMIKHQTTESKATKSLYGTFKSYMV